MPVAVFACGGCLRLRRYYNKSYSLVCVIRLLPLRGAENALSLHVKIKKTNLPLFAYRCAKYPLSPHTSAFVIIKRIS
jgi:hypothetical protein